MNLFAQSLLNAKTVEQVITAMSEMGNYGLSPAWKPVGDLENNLAIINLGSDPAAGAVERITNAVDSIIERKYIEKKTPFLPTSPRSATEEWFDLPKGRLAKMSSDEVRKYEATNQVVVTLHDSESPSVPTLDVRDYGTGILAEDFKESILGLNKNRKLNKLYLSGAFGQGGSTALAYSEITIIASRAMNENGKNHDVAITAVFFDNGDPKVDKHGYYKYLIDKTTGNPFTFELSKDEFSSGTLVRHVAMKLSKYNAQITQLRGSLWYLAHHYLFDPVLPFTIEDCRKKYLKKNKGKVLRRSVTGNNRRLSRGQTTEYQNKAVLTFGGGAVTVYWWVLKVEGKKPRDRVKQYTMASKPIVVTFNGQKQGDFPNTVIKNELKLPYLDRYLIVQVDCDHLDSESRRQLFPTTRESIRNTEIGDDLRRLIVETLAGDEELKRLDKERMKRLVSSVDSSSTEKVRKRLSNRVKLFASAGTKGSGPIISPPGVSSPKPL